MRNKKLIVLTAAALVAGLAFGNVASASALAAGAESANPVVAGACGLGLKMGAAVRDAGGRLVDIVAEATGLSVDEVRAQRQAGESLGSIASENGVAVDDVIADALAARQALLDGAVAAGTITQDRADAALANMESRLTERVNATTTGGFGAGQGAGRGRGMMGGNAGSGACGTCQTVAPAN